MSRNCVVLNLGRLVYRILACRYTNLQHTTTYMHIEAQNGVFLARTLQSSQLRLKLILRHMLSLLRRLLDRMISSRGGSPILIAGWLLLLPLLLRRVRCPASCMSPIGAALSPLNHLVIPICMLHRRRRKVLPRYVTPEAASAGIGRRSPWRAAGWIFHGWGSTHTIGALDKGALGLAALEAQVGRRDGNFGLGVRTDAGFCVAVHHHRMLGHCSLRLPQRVGLPFAWLLASEAPRGMFPGQSRSRGSRAGQEPFCPLTYFLRWYCCQQLHLPSDTPSVPAAVGVVRPGDAPPRPESAATASSA